MPEQRGQLRWLWLTVLVVALDQLTKAWVVSALSLYRPVKILPVFNLTLAYNQGAAFSFLASAGGWQRWLFTVVALVISAAVVVWMARAPQRERLLGAALALVLGGALGNLWDRITLGHVVDFLDFHWAGWHFPAFNMADSAITLGAALLIVDMLFGKGQNHDAD